MNILQLISQSGFQLIDLVIVLAYLALLVFLGLWLGRTKKGTEKSASDYFLAGNSLTWWAVGASLIAANISAEQFIGMSGTSYADGIATAAYELMAAVTLVVIGKFLLPIMLRRKIFTIPQFLRERYNDGVGLAFSILWLFLYVFVNLTSVAWLGALAIEQILGLQGAFISVAGTEISLRMIIIILLFVIAGIYSIYGGLASVAWTDVMQVVFLVGGGLVTVWFALSSVGAGDGVLAGLQNIYTDLTSGEHLNDAHLHLVIRQSANPSAFANVPGIAAIVGGVWLTNLGYWGFNQYIIQKGLAAKSVAEAQKGLIFAGFLKILIPFIVVLPGICAYYISLHPDIFTNLQGQIRVPDDAYPWLVRNFTPSGIKGLTFAALTAAIISSLASMLNSTSTLFTMDIYRKYMRPQATNRQLVRVGRLTSLSALIVATIAVKPLLGGLDQAFQYIQEYSGFIYPGIIIVFGLGLLWKRSTSRASVWTAILVIPMGVLFKIFLGDVPFQLRAGYIFIILLVFHVLMSLFDTKATEASELPDAPTQQTLVRWAYILGAIGGCCVLSAAMVSILSATTDLTWITYLKDIGFEAMYFFGALVGGQAIWLFGNARDTKRDQKALPVDLGYFRTDTGYAIGAAVIFLLVALIYILLW